MAYIGKTPTAVPLTSSDITNGIITTAKIADDAISAAKLASGVGGKVLQVVSVTKSDTFTISSSSLADITDLSLSITPASSSNKVLVYGALVVGGSSAHANFVIDRGGTDVGIGDAAGSRSRYTIASNQDSNGNQPIQESLMYLDSPSTTSATTYKIQGNNNGNTCYLNRTNADSDSSGYGRFISTFTLMEIAG